MVDKLSFSAKESLILEMMLMKLLIIWKRVLIYCLKNLVLC